MPWRRMVRAGKRHQPKPVNFAELPKGLSVMSPEASTIGGDQSVEQLRRELAEARERELATAEILRVISSSPMDLEPRFEQVAASAVRLCDAHDAVIFQVDGEMLRLVAHHGQIPIPGPVGQVMVPLTRALTFARALLDRQTIQIADLQAETAEYPHGSEFALALGFRTALAVPLVVSGKAVAVISIRRAEVREFTDRQIELLKVFADQAVIAIENSRLFEAEQASKRELQETLDYQTATSEVLNVISRSPTELQPVLDSIAATAARLCQSADAQVWRVQGAGLVMVAQHATLKVALTPLKRGTVTGGAVIDQKAIHVHDLAALVDTEYPDAKVAQAMVGHRTTLATPLISRGKSSGAILVRKMQVDPFSAKQMALLQRFADQAVIAIENARLFEAEQASKRELARSVEELESLGKVSQAVNSSLELDKVLATILEHACAMSYAGGGTVYVFDKATSEF